MSLTELIKSVQKKQIRIRGLSGSMDSVIVTAVFSNLRHNSHLILLNDREEAAYFHSDIQNLLSKKDILFFPSSSRKPYEYDETENANVIQRTEVLNSFNQKRANGTIIISYPEALCEKVIAKKTLVKKTIALHTGETIDLESLVAKLLELGFERTDFVYDPGAFAIRGGIVDIYSYANNKPFRIELFGNEIENIRIFNPESQLSEDPVKSITIIPNIQSTEIHESKQSFLSFLPNNTCLWFKDYQLALNTIEEFQRNAKEIYDNKLKESNKTGVIQDPYFLFETETEFSEQAEHHHRIEFGNRFFLEDPLEILFESEPQPSFNKNFDLIAQNLDRNQEKSIRNFIVAESYEQIQRLNSIFSEIDPGLVLDTLPINLRSGFVDFDTKVACYTDHQLFERYFKYKSAQSFSRSKALTLNELKSLQPGDYVTHIDHGIGRFVGLDKIEIGGKNQEALRLIYKNDDLLYVSIYSLHKISRYSGKEGIPPVLNKLGSPEWANKKKNVRKKVKDIARDLIQLYAKRKSAPGFAYSKDNYLQVELESSFLYEDTPDQAKATIEVKEDMQLPHPMDRLVCGDVGFGKTEIAMRAVFKAISDNKQVAVLVPTTILAMQHYRTFAERLENFPVNIDYINRFKPAKEQKEVLKKVKAGQIDVLIGTHRIVAKDVEFKDLGLLVIDEEQKFGVSVKEKLKKMRVNIDVLTLTATPIPRTLHFSLMGARDLSIIATPPPNRQSVITEIHTFNEEIIRDAISFELRRGGQVFFVHNRIKDIDQIGNIIRKLVPDASISVAHGQMEGKKLEQAMLRFVEGKSDVLISTNIIESGLDIPNANTIIINQAHMFGLSDLHQMRGRVGRSNKKAFCYLLSPPSIGLTSEAKKRLQTLEEFSHLGDGFKVAMRDLDIRGAGNLLGAEQSGFINDLGFDTYHKILDEAVQELKESEFKDLFKNDLVDLNKIFVADCVIETDFELLIPDTYISNISERLKLYTELDSVKDENSLQEYIDSVKDRFGPLPEVVFDLIKMVRLRWDAEQTGIEKLILKNGSLKAHLLPSDNQNYYNSSVFGNILNFLKTHPRECKLKESKNRVVLVVNDIDSISKASGLLKEFIK